MLILTSRTRVDKDLKYSFGSNPAVEKDSFYIEFESACINGADDAKHHCYIIVPNVLASIIRGTSVAVIKGYKLQKCEDNEADYLLFRTIQDNSEKIDIVNDGKLYLDFDGNHDLKFYLADKWRFNWINGHSVISDGTEELVCGKDIAAEYECTPAECYRWTLPNVRTIPEGLYIFQA